MLLAFIFATNTFAQAPAEGDGNANTKPTGKVFRCFANIGHTLSTARNPREWAGHAEYCVPKRPTKCMKDWDWSLDYKNDTAIETEASKNCKFTECRPNGGCNNGCHIFSWGAGRGTPVESYFYCAFDYDTNDRRRASDFDKISKCIDKQEGKEVKDRSLCNNDTTGARYYYKPNCEQTDTKEECDNKLVNTLKDSFRWRFCYEPPAGGNINSFLRNQGGQTVRFREFIAWDITGYNRTGPCEQMAFAPSGGNPPDEEPEPDIWGNMVIMDEKDKDRDESLVHTKITGEEYKFRIRALKVDGTDFEGGIKSLSCEIKDSEGNVILPSSPATQRNSGIVSKAIALFTGKMGYIYPSGNPFKPEKSGEYTITCTGTDANDTELSASAPFFVAPYKYVYENINATFENSTSSLSGRKDNMASISLLKETQELPYSKSESNAFKEVNIKVANWSLKPVVKIGEELKVSLSNASARTKEGILDAGVDVGANKIGNLVADTTATTLAITNADNPESASAASGECVSKVENVNKPATKQNLMTGGIADVSNPIVSIVGQEAQVARANIEIYDMGLYAKIRTEKQNEKCIDGDSTFPCPYPTKLRLTNFEYEITPKNFKVEVLDKNNNPIKVLYFGQGTSPKVEAGVKVRVTALKADGEAATTFENGCAAQNMQFAMDGNASGGNNQYLGYYFEIIGRDGAGFSVKAKDFKQGVAGSDDAIIKVQKDKDTPFTPAMKSEPVIVGETNAQFPAQMQYEKFAPETSYYPQYDSVNVSQGGKIAVLRARINSIDTDNGSGNLGGITPTKVWYEFQCEYCDLNKLAEITGHKYTNDDRSPTQQGWWIDRTFGENNGNYITTNKMEIEGGGINIGAITPNNGVATTTNAGLQSISYGNAKQGTHKLNIRHGNESNDGTFSGATTMPYFLLYNALWSGAPDTTTGALVSPIKWNTSSFIYVRDSAPNDERDYGVDTGGAKNTRSGGRTGKF